jgi:hypothetical protein
MTQMRKGIAAQMTRALQVPHAYVQMEVDLSNLVKLREREKKGYQAREGLSLSFVPFVVKASAEALKRNPTFNAHWTENGLLAKRRINIGIAVAVEGGLIVPVIRDVDNLSINGLNKAIAEVSERAAPNKFHSTTSAAARSPSTTRLARHEHGHADHQRARGRHRHHGPDHEAARSWSRRRRRRDRHPLDHEHGPRRRPPRQRRRRRRALLRDIKAWLEAVGPTPRSTRSRTEPADGARAPMFTRPARAATATAARTDHDRDGRRRLRDRPPTARRRSGGIRTGSRRSCRRATTTTTSSACSAA